MSSSPRNSHKRTSRRSAPFEPEGSQPRWDRTTRHTALLIAALGSLAIGVVIVYLPTLRGPFLFDDQVSIVENNTLRSIFPLARSLNGPSDTPTAGRPLANLSLAADYALFGLNPKASRSINVIWHLANTLLVFLLVRRAIEDGAEDEAWKRQSRALALIVAACWSLHPLQTEAVAYVTQRTELLMAFFLLLTMVAAQRAWDATSPSKRWVGQSMAIISCAMGMGCKEVMVVAPVLVPLYDWAMRKSSLASVWRKRGWFYLALMLCWGILIFLLWSNPRGRSAGFGLKVSPGEYFLTQCWAMIHYARLSIWPVGMCADYGVSLEGTRGIQILSLAGIAVGLLATLCGWFRHRPLGFLGMVFFLLLAPTSSFVPIITEPIAERRMYLALVSLLLLMVIAAAWLYRRLASRIELPLQRAGKLPFWFGGVGLAIVYGAISHARNQVYTSEMAFWTDVVAKRPDNPRGLNNLGLSCFLGKEYAEAEKYYRKAIELDRFHIDAHANLADLYLEQGRLAEARFSLDQAIAIDANHPHSARTLGKWLLASGDDEAALECFARVDRLQPDHVPTLCYLGMALLHLRRFEEAMRFGQRAVQLDPQSTAAINHLGNVYLAQSRFELAEECFRRSLVIDTKSSAALTNLGTIAFRRRDYRTAAEWFAKAIDADSQADKAHYNLGNCLGLLGRFDEAIESLDRYLQRRPNDESGWLSLGKVHQMKGMDHEARRCYERALQLNPASIDARRELQQIIAP